MADYNSSAFDMYRSTDKYAMSLTYRGPFIGDLTSRIVDISENAIARNQGKPMVNRKVSFLLVECFQNIIKHGESIGNMESGDNDVGLISLKNIDDAYIINSINVIKKEQVPELKEAVDYINSLDTRSLKDLYKKNLLENKINDKGGAGLGLIEMARKSRQKLRYEFEQVDEEFFLFHQQITFVNDNDNSVSSHDYIDRTRSLFNDMQGKNLLLQYKGDFSQQSVLPMLDIVQDNLAGAGSKKTVVKRAGHVLIEILQNMSKHSDGENGNSDGIFMIGFKDERIFVQVGNTMKNHGLEDLERWLNLLAGLEKEELLEIHKQRIRASIGQRDKSSSGLGLIEIAQAIAEPWQYAFDRIDNHKSFFSLYVNV